MFACGCGGKTLGHLSDEEITTAEGFNARQHCSRQQTQQAMFSVGCVTKMFQCLVPESQAHTQRSSTVILNHIQSCSVHLRRTVKFITSFCSSLRYHTWKHSGLGTGSVWVHVCVYVSVCKKKIVFFQYKYFGLAQDLFSVFPRYACLFFFPSLSICLSIHPSLVRVPSSH